MDSVLGINIFKNNCRFFRFSQFIGVTCSECSKNGFIPLITIYSDYLLDIWNNSSSLPI